MFTEKISTTEHQETVAGPWLKSIDQEGTTSLSYVFETLQAMPRSGLESDLVLHDPRRGEQEEFSEEALNLVIFDTCEDGDMKSTSERLSVANRRQALKHLLEQLEKGCDSGSTVGSKMNCNDIDMAEEDSYEKDSLVLARRRLTSLSHWQYSGVMVGPHGMYCSFDEMSDLDDNEWNIHNEDLHGCGLEEEAVCEPTSRQP